MIACQDTNTNATTQPMHPQRFLRSTRYRRFLRNMSNLGYRTFGVRHIGMFTVVSAVGVAILAATLTYVFFSTDDDFASASGGQINFVSSSSAYPENSHKAGVMVCQD